MHIIKLLLKKRSQSPPPRPEKQIYPLPQKKYSGSAHAKHFFVPTIEILLFFLLKGVEQVAFGRIGKTTSTILVSEGAECILINRKFFQQYLTDEVAKRIRRTVSYQFVHIYMYNHNFNTVYILIK